MSEDKYENILGGHVYTHSLQDLSQRNAPKLTENLPPVDIGTDSVVRRTDNYLIITGQKHYLDTTDPALDKNETKFLRFYIIPVTDNEHKKDQQRAEQLLESAAQQHQIPTELRLIRDQNGDTHMSLCIRFNFSEENWQEYVKADLSQAQTTITPDTVPLIGYLQKLFSEGKNTYYPPTAAK